MLSKMKSSLFTTLIFTFTLSLGISQESNDSINKLYIQVIDSIKNGNPAPNFKYLDINGDIVELKDFIGKVVYIDIWATWCGPCIKEIPHFERLKKKYRNEDIAFISISIDDNIDSWKKWVKKKKMSDYQLYANGNSAPIYYYTLIDTKELTILDENGEEVENETEDEYWSMIPVFVIIDKNGIIINNQALGPSSKEIKSILNNLL